MSSELINPAQVFTERLERIRAESDQYSLGRVHRELTVLAAELYSSIIIEVREGPAVGSLILIIDGSAELVAGALIALIFSETRFEGMISAMSSISFSASDMEQILRDEEETESLEATIVRLIMRRCRDGNADVVLVGPGMKHRLRQRDKPG